MGKALGKNILSKTPPRPHKLSKAEIKRLEEFQERQRELEEQKKAERLEQKQDAGTQKLKSMEAPEGVTDVKDERFGEFAGLIKGMSRPEDEPDAKKKEFLRKKLEARRKKKVKVKSTFELI